MHRVFDEPLRVLVVDDCPDTTHVLVRCLSALGCEAKGHHDAESCLDVFLAYWPHLVLLDLAMPVIDGFTIAVQLQQHAPAPFHLVAISGYGDKETVKRCKDAGFRRHLLKPIYLNELSQLVSETRKMVAWGPDKKAASAG